MLLAVIRVHLIWLAVVRVQKFVTSRNNIYFLHWSSEYSQAGEPSVDDEDLAHMVEMGFSLEVSRNALIVTQGNVEQALNLVMNQTDRYVFA